MFRPKFKVQINFKSGNSTKLWFRELSIDDRKNIHWHTCNYQKIVLLEVDEIEAIFQLSIKKWWQFWKF